jgi:ATP-dependent helicase/nuclease subunit B
MLSNARNKYLLQRIERTLHQVIAAQREARGRGQFRPAYAELGFGVEGGQLPPYRVTTPRGREMLLHGKIDRVDVLADQSDFAVIDYKLTGDSLALDRVYHGISLQLLTYMLVLQASGEKLAGRKLTPAAAFYVRLLRKLEDVKHPNEATPPDDPLFNLKVKPRGLFDIRALPALDSGLTTGSSDVVQVFITKDGALGRRNTSDGAEQDEFAALLRHVHLRIGQLGDQILSGSIEIGPYRMGRQTPCPRCEYRPLCRFDPGVNAYHTLSSMSREDVLARLKEGTNGGK